MGKKTQNKKNSSRFKGTDTAATPPIKTQDEINIDLLNKYQGLNAFRGLVYKVEADSFASHEQLENELKSDPFFQAELAKHLESLQNNLLIKLYNPLPTTTKDFHSLNDLLIALGTSRALLNSHIEADFIGFAKAIEAIYKLQIPDIFRYYITSHILNNFIKFNIPNKIICIINIIRSNTVISSSTLHQLAFSLSQEELNNLRIFITTLQIKDGNGYSYGIFNTILNFITRKDFDSDFVQNFPLSAALLACSYEVEYDFNKAFKEIDFTSASKVVREEIIEIFNLSIMNGNLSAFKAMLEKEVLALFSDIEIIEYFNLILTRGNAECLRELFNYIATNSDKLGLNYAYIVNSLELNQLTAERLNSLLTSIIAQFRDGILSTVSIEDFICKTEYALEVTLFLKAFLALIIISNQETINKEIKELKNILSLRAIDKMVMLSENKKEILINAISPYIEKIILKEMQSATSRLGFVVSTLHHLISSNKKELAQNIVRNLFAQNLINIDFLMLINRETFKEVLLEQTNLINIIEQSKPVAIYDKTSVSILLQMLYEEKLIEITSENLLKIQQILEKNELDVSKNILVSLFNISLEAEEKLAAAAKKEQEIKQKETELKTKEEEIDQKEQRLKALQEEIETKAVKIKQDFARKAAELTKIKNNLALEEQEINERFRNVLRALQQKSVELKKEKKAIDEQTQEIAKFIPPEPEIVERLTTVYAQQIIYQTEIVGPLGVLYSVNEGPIKYTTTTTQQNNNTKKKAQNQQNSNKLSESDLTSKIDQNKFKEFKVKQKDLSLKELKIDAVIVNEEKEDYNYSKENAVKNNDYSLKPLERLNATTNAEQFNKIGFDNHFAFTPILTMGGEGSNFVNFDQDPLQQVNIAY